MQRDSNWCDLRVALAWVMDETGQKALQLKRRLSGLRRIGSGLAMGQTQPVPMAYAKAERKAWLKLGAMAENGQVLLRGERYIPSLTKRRDVVSMTAIAAELIASLELDNDDWNDRLRPRDWQKEDENRWRNVSVDFRGKFSHRAASRSNLAIKSKSHRVTSKSNMPSQVDVTKLIGAGLTGKRRAAFDLTMDFFGPDGPPDGFGPIKIMERIRNEGTDNQRARLKEVTVPTLKIALESIRKPQNPG